MDTTSSQIQTIIDYTAAVAAREIEGVKMIFGAGSGLVDDPLRPGRKVLPAPSDPPGPFCHWSDVPNAPDVEWVSQNFTAELEWQVPMRLWLPKQDEEARRLVLPFYDRYLRAFMRDPFLGERPYSDLALRTSISHLRIGGDKEWSWLDVGLLVVERVNYAS